MSQATLIIPDSDGATLLSNLSTNLQALGSTSKGNSRPSTPYAGQLWLDDNTPSSTRWTLNMYDGTDDIALGVVDVTNNAFFSDSGVKGADVASASTLDLSSATGDLVDVTGTTTITAITLAEGRQRVVRFTGALTLTNGASLVLPGAANIVTVSGDFAVFRGYSGGVVRCIHYQRSASAPVEMYSGAALQSATASYPTYSTTTTVIPTDDTIPQNTEGTEIITVPITPKYAGSNLRIRFSGFGAVSVAGSVVAAVFRDTTADAVYAVFQANQAGYGSMISGEVVIAASSTSPTTLKLRVGPNTGTLYINGDNVNRFFGGVAAWRMTVEELRA